MNEIFPSFPKIWHLGSPEAANLLNGTVEVTEKVDGSQFSFGKIEGQLRMRSKGQEVFPETADKNFKPVIEHVLAIAHLLPSNKVYYGETLGRPKHNALAYERTPKGNFILFGVKTVTGWIYHHEDLELAADWLECEAVPLIYRGSVSTQEFLQGLLDRESVLGKEKIEGVVIKNYGQLAISAYSRECFVKLVRPEFKERNHSTHPSKSNRMESFLQGFKTEARWQKAYQHLNDKGVLTHSPADIGKLLKEIQDDLVTEEESFIREEAYKFVIRQVLKTAVEGAPEWYKAKLVERQFNAQQQVSTINETGTSVS